MHAVIRETTYPEGMSIDQVPEFQEFQRAHANLSGYMGTVVVDTGAGRFLTLTVWRTAEEMSAARDAMGPIVERTVNPLMTSPAKLLGTGRVVVNDLAVQE